MKRILIMVGLALACGAAKADQYVNGYYEPNGTYVQPHYQTAPDGNPYNNYSTRGNVNPYTGQPGYINPNPQPRVQQPFMPMQPNYGGRR